MGRGPARDGRRPLRGLTRPRHPAQKKTPGLHDRVNNHWGQLYRHAFLTSLVGAAGQLSQPQRSAEGFRAASAGQEVAGEIGRDLAKVTERVLERNLEVRPTLEIRARTSLNVVLTEDVYFAAELP